MNPNEIINFPAQPVEIFKGPIPLEVYLAAMPNLRQRFERILRKLQIEIPSDLPVLIDPTMPAHIGGGYGTLGSQHWLFLNPMILLGSELELAHVLVHEGIHAGIVKHPLMFKVKTEVQDEPIVESLSKDIMMAEYGTTGIKTGYDPLVAELKSFMSGQSFSELARHIDNDSSGKSLEKLVEAVVLEPLLRQGELDLSKQAIDSALAQRWDVLCRLFSRLINGAFNTGRGVHESVGIEMSAYSPEHLYRRAAALMLNHPKVMRGVIRSAAAHIETYTPETIYQQLVEMGYGYAWAENPAAWFYTITSMLDRNRERKQESRKQALEPEFQTEPSPTSLIAP